MPDDLAERGRQYHAQHLGGGAAVELNSHLPIERQARVIGATWLDQQLIGGGKGLGNLGFGGEVKSVLQQRADFLAEQGLAERRGQRVGQSATVSVWPASIGATSCSPAGATPCSVTAWGSTWCRGSQ